MHSLIVNQFTENKIIPGSDEEIHLKILVYIMLGAI